MRLQAEISCDFVGPYDQGLDKEQHRLDIIIALKSTASKLVAHR